jgi:hypothetical protein
LGNLATPKSVQKLQPALHAKAKAEAGYRFYALYDKISREDILARAYAQCRSYKSLPLRRQGARRGSTARILRTSRPMGSSDGWRNWRLRSGRRLTGQILSDELLGDAMPQLLMSASGWRVLANRPHRSHLILALLRFMEWENVE